jgi:hypothetical protein
MEPPELDVGSRRVGVVHGNARLEGTAPPARNGTEAGPVAQKGGSKAPWIVAGVVGVLILLLVVVGVVAGVGAWFYFSSRSYDAETPVAVAPVTTEADFAIWREQLERLASAGTAAAPLPAVGAGVGWWDRHFVLPPEPLVRAALERRLPPGMTVVSLVPVTHSAVGGGVRVVYRVGLVSQMSLYLVSAGPLPPPKDFSELARKWVRFAILAPDLPAGTAYQLDQAVAVLQPGQAVELDWTVRRAARVNGAWRIWESDPIVYQRNPDFERRLRQAPGTARFLRTESELAAARAMSASALEEIKAAAADVAARAAEFRREALAGVPKAAVDTGGRGGSGTPTKTGVGALSGAALGGGIGAAAGDGEGAAIGAGVGALLGGIIGYNVGRADEKSAVQRQNAARQQALSSANSRAAAYQAQITRETEQALRERAAAHDARLAAGGF